MRLSLATERRTFQLCIYIKIISNENKRENMTLDLMRLDCSTKNRKSIQLVLHLYIYLYLRFCRYSRI